MKSITRNQIHRLTEEPTHLCLSIYMPVYSTSPEDRHQNEIRYGNLIRQAKEKLAVWGTVGEDAENFLAPIRDMDWSVVTSDRHRGLAIFLSKSGTRVHAIPYETPEFVFVNERFYLRPLLPFLGLNTTFYIVTVTMNKWRFYEASRYSIRRIKLEGLPEDLSDEAEHDGRAGHTAFRAKGHEGSTVIVHPKGGVLDDIRTDSETMLRIVNAEVIRYLEQSNQPLVILGSEQMATLYKGINGYPYLAPQMVTVDPESLSDEQIHDKALHVVDVEIESAWKDAAGTFYNLQGTGLTSTDLPEIVKAADAARIRDLFLKLEIQCWGFYDRATQTVELASPDTPKADDLIDLAAFLTLQKGGKIWASLEEATPANAEIAASYRF